MYRCRRLRHGEVVKLKPSLSVSVSCNSSQNWNIEEWVNVFALSLSHTFSFYCFLSYALSPLFSSLLSLRFLFSHYIFSTLYLFPVLFLPPLLHYAPLFFPSSFSFRQDLNKLLLMIEVSSDSDQEFTFKLNQVSSVTYSWRLEPLEEQGEGGELYCSLHVCIILICLIRRQTHETNAACIHKI